LATKLGFARRAFARLCVDSIRACSEGVREPTAEYCKDLQLTFGKGQYAVVIEYRGDKANDPDWNYAIDVGWHDVGWAAK